MLRAGGESGSDRGRIHLLRKMRSSPAIRRGRAADLFAVSQLLGESGLPTADLASAQAFQFWVHEEEGSILGVIGLERFGSEALLRSLAVVPQKRHLGLGQQLVAHVEHDARAGGIERLVLLTETAESFFRRSGYMVTDRDQVSDEVKQSAEFRSLCPVSAICMSKALRHG